MAVDKKTRFELEEQKKIADEVREAFDENSTKLRKSYSCLLYTSDAADGL